MQLKVVTLLQAPCFALATPKFGTLKSTMKEMNTRVKTVAQQIDNSSLDTQSAALSDEVVQLADDSARFVPDIIAQAPPSDRAGMTEQYKKMLNQTHQLAADLAKAIRSGNKSAAKDLLKQLNENKKDGHTDFK